MKNFIIGLVIGSAVAFLVVAFFAVPTFLPEKDSRPHAETDFFDLRERDETLVSIRDGRFEPPNIIIKKGAKVIWENESGEEHIIDFTSTNITDSPVLQKGGVYEYIFIRPGTYMYKSSNYPEAKGVIKVE